MKHLSHMRTAGDDGWLGLAIICDKDNVGTLRDHAWNLATSYPGYDGHIASSTTPPAPSAFGNIKELMADFYHQAPAELKRRLLARRHDHGLLECPYCGSPGKPDTLDHFMPQGTWPEFSIYPNNLVPQCRDCMPVKGERYYCSTRNDALFLHPVYHDMLAQLAFGIDITMNRGTPTFAITFSVLKTLDAADKKRLTTHIAELDLQARIVKFCHREYGEWKNQISANRFDIEKTLGACLAIYPAFNAGAAPNWEAAFYKGVLQNQEFLRHLESFAPKVARTAAPVSAVETLPC
ncbi:HNH endonuclease [Burkholderia cepacia]|uniref:HNH endonuclease n=1 Tax=Burkholderia cepacia TaxID=292 RepID=UPI00398E7B0F